MALSAVALKKQMGENRLPIFSQNAPIFYFFAIYFDKNGLACEISIPW
jgi:hypothetical protein